MKFRETDKTRTRHLGWWIGGGAAVVLVAAYAIVAGLLGGQIPQGTSVHGVQIGGLDASAAAGKLHSELDPIAARDIPLAASGRTAALSPTAAGLELDVEATLAGQTGYSLDPTVMWHRLVGGGPLEPELNADSDELRSALEGLRDKLDTAPTEGSLAFKDAKVVLKEPVTGSRIDADAAVDVVEDSWFDASTPIDLPVTATDPKVPADEFTRVRDEQAEPLVKAPVTITAGKLKAKLSQKALAAAASFTVADGKLSMELDNKKVAAALLDANPDMASTAKDARIVLRDGKPAIIPSVQGHGVDTDDLSGKVLAATTTAERTTEIDITSTRPELTTADAKKLGVKEEIVEFSTPYPTYDTVRTKNLRAGSAKLNGLVVMPGETFSLTKALAPITIANGYYKSGVVVDGFSSEAVGGGLSQISTQLFNIGFLAGMDDVAHQPHSRWFKRYPAGRESTLWEGIIDMAWRNNTGHAVMIQAWVGDNRVHNRLWGTKKWTVHTTTSEHYNRKNPTTVYNTADKCVPESGGQKGFTVAVTRTRASATETLPKETLRWTYQPWNKVVCGPKPGSND